MLFRSKKHQEVTATNGWCGDQAFVIGTPNEAAAVPDGRYLLVCQTTIRKDLLDEIVDVLVERKIDLQVENTICNATRLRQDACADLARRSDVAKLTRDDVKDGYIQIVTQKTSDGIKIELNKYSQAILDKYDGLTFGRGRTLPVISNQKMNESLKELGRLIEIGRASCRERV